MVDAHHSDVFIQCKITVNGQLSAAVLIVILAVIDETLFDCRAYFQDGQEYRPLQYNE